MRLQGHYRAIKGPGSLEYGSGTIISSGAYVSPCGARLSFRIYGKVIALI